MFKWGPNRLKRGSLGGENPKEHQHSGGLSNRLPLKRENMQDSPGAHALLSGDSTSCLDGQCLHFPSSWVDATSLSMLREAVKIYIMTRMAWHRPIRAAMTVNSWCETVTGCASCMPILPLLLTVSRKVWLRSWRAKTDKEGDWGVKSWGGEGMKRVHRSSYTSAHSSFKPHHAINSASLWALGVSFSCFVPWKKSLSTTCSCILEADETKGTWSVFCSIISNLVMGRWTPGWSTPICLQNWCFTKLDRDQGLVLPTLGCCLSSPLINHKASFPLLFFLRCQLILGLCHHVLGLLS